MMTIPDKLPKVERTNTVLFFGVLNSVANLDALDFMLYDLAPVLSPVLQENNAELRIVGKAGSARLTHYAFGQLAGRVGAPASYIRNLPATLAAQNLNYGLANKSAESVPFEIKTWLGLPSGGVFSIVNVGADCSIVVPSGTDLDLGPVPLLPVEPGTPVGMFEVGCRILDCQTGEERSIDVAPFEVQ